MLPARAARTHRGEIQATSLPAEALDATFRLFRAALGPLEDAGKLGYVLFQFAPWVRFAPERLDVPRSAAGAPARAGALAVEFRDRSWFPDHADETLAVLRRARLAHVIVDAPAGGARGAARGRAHRADRGLPAARPQRRGLAAPAARRGARRAREVRLPLHARPSCASSLPEVEATGGGGGEVFVSFNNNNRDYPVRNALMMKRLLGPAGDRRRPPAGARRSLRRSGLW